MNAKHAGLGEYDVTLIGPELQTISEVSALKPKYENPKQYATVFNRPHFVDKLASLQLGELCLSANTFGTDLIDAVTDAHIVVRPELRQGRHESARAVTFGQLVLNTKDRGQRGQLVAIKYNQPEFTAREYLAMKFINDHFKIGNGGGSFNPLGFVKHQEYDDIVGLITEFNMDVITLDSLFWRKNNPPTDQEVEYGLTHAAHWLGLLHGYGIAHRDPQPKNVGYDIGSRPRYPDLEWTRNLRLRNGALDANNASMEIKSDLQMFLTHLNGEYHQAVDEFFTPNYLRCLGSKPINEVVTITTQEITDISRDDQALITHYARL